jgi:hypothetical protein
VAVAVAALAPAAAASPTPQVKLALLPLPKTVIGSVAKPLQLARDSGVVSNLDAASATTDATTPDDLRKLGRVTGYTLDYGNPFAGAAGLTAVQTAVEQYKTAADARRGLAFWRKEDAELSWLDQPGFAVTNKLVPLPAVGARRFAFLTSFSAANIAPLSTIDEQFLEGRYVLDVKVAAGTGSAAQALAPKLAKELDGRVRLALARRLHGRPVKLPPGLKAGPPEGGPDLSALAFATTDLTGQATVVSAGYGLNEQALSDYGVLMFPAGQFDVLGQDIVWYPTANEASFVADAENALALHATGSEQIDLTAVGEGAQGVLGSDASGGSAQLVFSNGLLAEFVFVGSNSAVQESDVAGLAQTAASKIKAALGS